MTDASDNWPEEEFRALAKRYGITDNDLDDGVHQAASEIATSINNEGIEGQLKFLYDQWGETALREYLEELKK